MRGILRLTLGWILVCLAAGVGMAQTAGFTASATSGCATLVVQFTSTSTGATSYYWNLGNGASVPTTNSSPSTSYLTPGTYTVTLHINSPSGPAATKTITVYPGPTVNFSVSPTAGCPPLPVSFSSTVTPNAPGSTSYTWNYGDGTLGTNVGGSPSHVYTTSGWKTVSLAVTNGVGCTTTKVVTNAVNVYPKPSASFTANNTLFCKVPATVSFLSANASGVSYAWSFSNSTTSSSANPVVTFNSPGTYSATLVATSSQGCKDTLVRNNFIEVYANNAQFSAPDSACDSSNVYLQNTTPGVTGGTYWDFGDGTNDTGKSLQHFYTSSGSFTISMVTQVGQCLDTVTKTILIRPKPVIQISRDVPCIPGTMHFTATSSVSISSYSWSWALGGTATGNPVSHYYGAPAIDSVYLVASSGSGCKDTAKDIVFAQDWYNDIRWTQNGCPPLNAYYKCLNPPCTHVPCVAFGRLACSPGLDCKYPELITSFTWWVDGVLTATTDSFNITYTTPGVHEIVLKTVTANGCIRWDTVTTCVGHKVEPSFHPISDTVVCVNDYVYFKNTTNDSSAIYSWYYGRNERDSVNDATYDGKHSYQFSKTDTVMLIATVCGCSDTAIRLNCVTVHLADAHFEDSVWCPPSRTVSFKNVSPGATTHFWDFGDGDTSTLETPPPHTFPDTGLYMVRHYTWNATYGCRDTVIDSVRIVPFAISILGDTTICLGDTIKLDGFFTGFFRTDGYWPHNPNGLTPTDSTLDHFYVLSDYRGFYTFHWMVKSIWYHGETCYDTASKTVLISHPEADFRISSKIGCTPFTATFLDSTSYTPGTQPQWREWIFGDGTTAANNNASITHTYTAAGKYSVRLKVTDWIGCTDSLWKIDSVEARHPVAAFSLSQSSGCTNLPIHFLNGSTGATGLSYHWSFGDGNTSTADSPSHAYANAGKYTVTLIATDSSGCSDTLVKNSAVSISHPIASFNLSDSFSVCPPLIVNFSSTSTNATSFAWDFKNGSTSNLAYPATTFINSGVYNVRLIVADTTGCMDTAYRTVRILGYSGALSYSPVAGCVPLTVTFNTSLSNVALMVWDFSNGDTARVTGSTYSYTYTTPGAYVPKLIFYDNSGCSSSSAGLDTIKVDAVTAGFRIAPPCEKTVIQFFDSSQSLFSPMASWYWDFGGGHVASGSPVSRVYPAPGRYPVTLIARNSRGCADTLVDSFTIYARPVITARPDTSVCIPDAIPLWAMGGLSYSWSPAGPLSCSTCDTPKAAPTVPTNFIVTGTDARGCSNIDTVRVDIQAKTTFTVIGNGEICEGDSFLLAATGASVYHWTPSESLNNPDTSSPIARPKVTTVYIATGWEGSCRADTHMVRVVVNPLPTIDAGQDALIVAGNKVQLQAFGTGLSHVAWTADSSLSCTDCYAPYAAPYKTTTYYITGYSAKGCKAMDSVMVRVLCDQSQLFIPNTFTPNGDGLNDYFFPRGKGIEVLHSFRIYNRWGELLFHRENMQVNDEYAGWNGTYKGQKLVPDVYVYVIDGTCGNGDPIQWKGDVTLIR